MKNYDRPRFDPFALKTMQPLIDFFRNHNRLLVITGAGISTESGIPDYRDPQGNWKRKPPITHQEFVKHEHQRKRYWARSLVGWRFVDQARPNVGHRVLAQLEQAGYVQLVVTQNVDGLHQQAGSQHVVELHGQIASCVCIRCGVMGDRQEFQTRLEKHNPRYAELSAHIAPDGDADLNFGSFDDFAIPPCLVCGGVIMPNVVFYGGNVPKTRVDYVYQQLEQVSAVLVVGSSLMVYSSFRFCRAAAEQGKPLAALNRGRTRADDLLSLKVEDSCSQILTQLAQHLNLPPSY